MVTVLEGRSHLGATWVDPEPLAYNTYGGAPSGSNRKGLVRFPDGKLRRVRLGVADTAFSIPARPSRGRVGIVTVRDGEYCFTSVDYNYLHGSHDIG